MLTFDATEKITIQKIIIYNQLVAILDTRRAQSITLKYHVHFDWV